MYRVLQILTAAEVEQCRKILADAPFVDGRITNPHNTAKANEQLHDAAAYQKSSDLLKQDWRAARSFASSPFRGDGAADDARYRSSMRYGAHADAAFIQLPGATIRSDLSCTIFLNDPQDYEGGELHIRVGDADLTFKLQPDEAIVYPSDTLHQVERSPRAGGWSRSPSSRAGSRTRSGAVFCSS